MYIRPYEHCNFLNQIISRLMCGMRRNQSVNQRGFNEQNKMIQKIPQMIYMIRKKKVTPEDFRHATETKSIRKKLPSEN